jgi:hypothetical protein
MTNPDWTPEEDEAFNAVEKQSNLGKQILKEMGQPYHFDKREWVGLTSEDMHDPRTHNFDFIYGARWAEALLKEKNT